MANHPLIVIVSGFWQVKIRVASHKRFLSYLNEAKYLKMSIKMDIFRAQYDKEFFCYIEQNTRLAWQSMITIRHCEPCILSKCKAWQSILLNFAKCVFFWHFVAIDCHALDFAKTQNLIARNDDGRVDCHDSNYGILRGGLRDCK
ncbi:hypothetical protein [Helicobacter sp. T3_23-1056]